MNPKLNGTLCRTIIGAGLVALATATMAGSTNTNSSSTSTVSSTRASNKVEKASSLIGREVLGSGEKQIGRIDDLVVDLESGRVLYAVVRVNGFFGLGERRVGVPAGAFQPHGEQWQIPADKQRLAAAPQFTREQEAQLESATFLSNTFRYFNQTPWWGGPDVQFNNTHKLTALIGMDLKDLANAKIGAVADLAVNLQTGRIICAVVSRPDRQGGLSALPPNALSPSADRRSLTTGIEPEKLAAAPYFEKDHWPDMTDPAWAARLYQYFGKQAYFDSGELRATGQTNSPPRIYHEPGEPKK
jgi:sporulation protein YlmC with PRC-barrel domain